MRFIDSKRLASTVLVVGLVLGLAADSLAQGSVYFSNITQDGSAEVILYSADSGVELGSDYYVQLFASPASADDSALQPVDIPTLFFDTPAGIFFGGVVQIPGVPSGEWAKFQ